MIAVCTLQDRVVAVRDVLHANPLMADSDSRLIMVSVPIAIGCLAPVS